jgi:dihydroneopterin triphosphate diphosphatase
MQQRKYQILVLPFFISANQIQYALFKRKDMNVWQGIAGGAEDGETPDITASREAYEEAGISLDVEMIMLKSMTTIPVVDVCKLTNNGTLVIPEFSFGVELKDKKIKISPEHSTYQWFSYEEAREKLEWDSNKSALWELNYRILNKLL